MFLRFFIGTKWLIYPETHLLSCWVMISMEGVTVRYFLQCSKLSQQRIGREKMGTFLSSQRVQKSTAFASIWDLRVWLKAVFPSFALILWWNISGNQKDLTAHLFFYYLYTPAVFEQLMIISSVPKPACFGKHYLGHLFCKLHTCKVNISLLLWESNKAFGSKTLKLLT